jgi:Protein of unknown function (DUF3237)
MSRDGSCDTPRVTELALAFEIVAELAPPVQVGQTPRGLRRVVPIIGGSVEGERVHGRILPGGADWQFERADGVLEAEAHYELELEDGTIVSVVNRGMRRASAEVMARLRAGEIVDASQYYFRTTPAFEAPDGPHDWLNRSVFVADGERLPDAVRLRVYEVL